MDDTIASRPMVAGLARQIAAPGRCARRATGRVTAIRIIAPFAAGSIADAAIGPMLPYLAAQPRRASASSTSSRPRLRRAGAGRAGRVHHRHVVTPGLQVGSIEPGAHCAARPSISARSWRIRAPSSSPPIAPCAMSRRWCARRRPRRAPSRWVPAASARMTCCRIRGCRRHRFRHGSRDAQIVAALAGGQIRSPR